MTLFIYRGLPGSGKTTLARANAEWVQEGGGKAIVIGRDHIRKALFDRYALSQDEENQVTQVQNNSIDTSLRAGWDVHVDDMNLKNRYVRGLIVRALDNGVGYKIIDLTDVPLSTCLQRNSERDRQVPPPVIADLHERFIKGKKYPLPVYLPNPDNSKKFAPYTPNYSLPNAIGVDIDGTLAHCGDRDIYDGSKAHLDTLDEAVAETISAMFELGYAVFFCSGRSDKFRDVTAEWLAINIDYLEPEYIESNLFMRKEGDERNDAIVKLELFDQYVRDRYNVLYMLDDRDRVVEAWRSIGLKVFQVAPGNF